MKWKEANKYEVAIADQSGSIFIKLWDEQASKIQVGCTFLFLEITMEGQRNKHHTMHPI